MKHFASAAMVLLFLCTTGCVTNSEYDRYGMAKDSHVGKHVFYGNRLPPMEPGRLVSLQDCHSSYVPDTGNLRCI